MGSHWTAPGVCEESLEGLVLVWFSVAVINTMTKSNLGRKGFITTLRLESISKEKHYRNPKAGTEAEATEESC